MELGEKLKYFRESKKMSIYRLALEGTSQRSGEWQKSAYYFNSETLACPSGHYFS